MHPDFSIVTPSYNYADFIGECLQSVAEQEGVTFEHLVMDAGSGDNTQAVVAGFPHAAFFQEPDKGMSDGINKGFLRARGTWVMWLNADDRLKPGALQAVKQCGEAHSEADVIYGCWNFVDVEGKFLRRMTVFPFNHRILVHHGCYIASTATFFRRATTIEQGYMLNIKFRSVMDGEYFCRLAAAGKRFEYLPRVLADFRLHDKSISQRNILKTDIDGMLAYQGQIAESRAIRRTYGIRLFKDEMLNGVVEGLLYHLYRFLKGWLRWVHLHELVSEGWNGDLATVLSRISGIATGGGGWRVLPAGARLALALPADRAAAAVVIRLYQPQRWTGRMFSRLAKLLVYSGIARRLPSFRGKSNEVPQVSWLQAAAEAGSVGFLGCNPAHGWRCVLAGIDPESGTPFVAKLGLDESSAAVQREATMLQSLHGRFLGVVASLGCEVGEGWALLRLPHLGDDSPTSMRDGRIKELLMSWMHDEWIRVADHPWAVNLIERIPEASAPSGWHERMLSHRVRRSLMHGDFAVWNLRVTRDGLCAIDWEWAVEDGIAGIDLVHGLRQEGYMVRKLRPADAVKWMLEEAGSPAWSCYLDAAGWNGRHEDIVRLGLLHSHFNAINDSAELLEVLGIKVKG